MSSFKPSQTLATVPLILIAAVVVCAIHAAVFWLGHVEQPLVDQHTFRQTQTALTAFYLFKDGVNLLDYQTPVIGSPWSVPFEFPTFQLIVAAVQRFTGIDLSTAGRAISIFFGLGCLGLGLKILQLFKVHASALAIFAMLYLVSPIYLYWNRTFMIESTALFFTLLALLMYWQIKKSWEPAQALGYTTVATLMVSLTLALVTKATTALPILLFIGLDWILTVASRWRGNQQQTILQTAWRTAPILVVLILSFLLLKGWTFHADHLKAGNLIGAKLTSAGLAGWNFGTPLQRISMELWREVMVNRMLTPRGGLSLLILLVVGTLKTCGSSERRYLLISCLGLALAPLLIFTNLHIIHNYYQCANQIFLLLAVSVACSSLIASSAWMRLLAVTCLTVALASFINSFRISYLPSALITNSDQMEIGQAIRDSTRPTDAILVFGEEWSSAVAFHSQRKSLTFPGWPTMARDLILAEPSRFLAGMPLGAIVLHDQALTPAELTKACPSRRTIRLKLSADWVIHRCGTSAAAV